MFIFLTCPALENTVVACRQPTGSRFPVHVSRFLFRSAVLQEISRLLGPNLYQELFKKITSIDNEVPMPGNVSRFKDKYIVIQLLLSL